MRFLILFLLLTISKVSLSAPPNLLLDGGLAAHLSTKNNFAIQVDDEVTGGCLPNPNTLKDKLEIGLRRNGFSINENNPLVPTIYISALGYKTSTTDSCAVVLTYLINFYVVTYVPYADNDPPGTTLTLYQYPAYQELLTGPRSQMQSRLEAVSLTAADNIYLDISRSRDEIFKKFPNIKNNYEVR